MNIWMPCSSNKIHHFGKFCRIYSYFLKLVDHFNKPEGAHIQTIIAFLFYERSHKAEEYAHRCSRVYNIYAFEGFAICFLDDVNNFFARAIGYEIACLHIFRIKYPDPRIRRGIFQMLNVIVHIFGRVLFYKRTSGRCVKDVCLAVLECSEFLKTVCGSA